MEEGGVRICSWACACMYSYAGKTAKLTRVQTCWGGAPVILEVKTRHSHHHAARLGKTTAIPVVDGDGVIERSHVFEGVEVDRF